MTTATDPAETPEPVDPVVIAFPLRGEGWVAVNSPADRVPSHGTDMLAQRFAFDFVKVDGRRRLHVHRAGTLRTLVLGVPTRECYAWGAPLHAPFDGEVVRAVDGRSERTWIHPLRELVLAMLRAMTFQPSRLPAILGNHVIIRHGPVFAGLVHLAPGTVAVQEGQRVQEGDVIGRVGHTGNSTTPHLHIQLMDAADPTVAKPIPCAFRRYEVFRDGVWQAVHDGIPRRSDRIRSLDPGP
jgi:hypothetical protein